MEEFGGWSYGLFWHRWKKSGDYKMIVLVRKMMFGYKVMMSEDAMYDDGVVMEAVGQGIGGAPAGQGVAARPPSTSRSSGRPP